MSQQTEPRNLKDWAGVSVREKLIAVLNSLEDMSQSTGEGIALVEDILRDHPELEWVGKEGIITIPDSDHMTEYMIDATRSLHNCYENEGNSGGATFGQLFRQFAMGYPWVLKYIPAWASKLTGHMTKSDRTILGHHLVTAAWTDHDNFLKWPTIELIEHFEDDRVKAKIERLHKETAKKLEPENFSGKLLHKIVGRFKVIETGEEFSVPMKLYPHVRILGDRGTPVSILIGRNDVPKPFRTLVKRTGTKIMFIIDKDLNLVQGPYVVHDRPGQRPEKAAFVCTAIEKLTARLPDDVKTPEEEANERRTQEEIMALVEHQPLGEHLNEQGQLDSGV